MKPVSYATSQEFTEKEAEKFVIRCTVCDRTYAEFALLLKPGEMYEYDFGGLVPCHADGLNLLSGVEDPWARVMRFLDPKLEKKAAPKSKYMLSVHGFDTVISVIRIVRQD